jgi:hypothetical protein
MATNQAYKHAANIDMGDHSWLRLNESVGRWRRIIESITYSEWRPGGWTRSEGRKEREKNQMRQEAGMDVVDETLPPKSRRGEAAVFGFLYLPFAKTGAL